MPAKTAFVAMSGLILYLCIPSVAKNIQPDHGVFRETTLIHAQSPSASPSGSLYPLITREPTPLIINRIPEYAVADTPEIPLITYLKKFLYMLADLIGVKLPGRSIKTQSYY